MVTVIKMSHMQPAAADRCFPAKKYAVRKRRRQLDMGDWKRSLCIRCFHLAPLSMESGSELYKCPPNNRLSDETYAPRQLAL